MNTVFSRFRVETAENTRERMRYEVLTHAGPVIRTEEGNYPVAQAAMLPSMAHGLILSNTLARVRSHLLFHAAALSYKGRGIILVANSGSGKTTLSLALVRAGFKLLSDEIAALSLADGRLAPYPRCLLVHSGTRKVFADMNWRYPEHRVAYKDGNKEAIHLADKLLAHNSQPDYVIFIKKPSTGSCYITLDRVNDGLVTDLQGIAEINPNTSEESKWPSNLPVLTANPALLPKIGEICQQHGVQMLDVEQKILAPVFYKRTAEIKKITKWPGTIELFKAFYTGSRSVLIQEEAKGSSAKLLLPLSKIMAQTEFYQLWPGRLDNMVETINELWQS
jgi:hypothetical protein